MPFPSLWVGSHSPQSSAGVRTISLPVLSLLQLPLTTAHNPVPVEACPGERQAVPNLSIPRCRVLLLYSPTGPTVARGSQHCEVRMTGKGEQMAESLSQAGRRTNHAQSPERQSLAGSEFSPWPHKGHSLSPPPSYLSPLSPALHEDPLRGRNKAGYV